MKKAISFLLALCLLLSLLGAAVGEDHLEGGGKALGESGFARQFAR